MARRKRRIPVRKRVTKKRRVGRRTITYTYYITTYKYV